MSSHILNGQKSSVTSINNGNGNNNTSSYYPPPTAKYEDVAQSSDLFWATLKAFHKSFGDKFNLLSSSAHLHKFLSVGRRMLVVHRIPTVGGKALDLHRLFVEVTSRGGLEKVIRDRRWKEVIVAFNFPTTITSASFVLRKYYLSLIYHFEQVYYFRKQSPSLTMPDAVSGSSLDNGSASPEEDFTMNHLGSQGSPKLQLGCTVTGVIDGKFDNGYLVTVNMGSEQLKGVLYHIPNEDNVSQSSNNLVAPTHRRRKRSRLASRDPSRPKSNRSGYNFFFAEHYARLKPHYYGQEKAISKKIGVLWSNLTEAEKQVYQEKGLKDKERYKSEMLEYRSSNDSTVR